MWLLVILLFAVWCDFVVCFGDLGLVFVLCRLGIDFVGVCWTLVYGGGCVNSVGFRFMNLSFRCLVLVFLCSVWLRLLVRCDWLTSVFGGLLFRLGFGYFEFGLLVWVACGLYWLFDFTWLVVGWCFRLVGIRLVVDAVCFWLWIACLVAIGGRIGLLVLGLYFVVLLGLVLMCLGVLGWLFGLVVGWCWLLLGDVGFCLFVD